MAPGPKPSPANENRRELSDRLASDTARSISADNESGPSPAISRLLVFTAAFLFSTGGAAIKACTLTSWQIASFRSGVAGLLLLFFLRDARRNWTLRTFVMGLSYAGTVIFFVLATKLTTSANAIFLQSTAPLYLLLLGPFVLRERIRRVDLLVIAAVFSGALLLVFGSQSASATAPNPRSGNVFGLISGVTWALTLTGLRWTSKRAGQAESSISVVTVGNLLAFVICLPMALPLTDVTSRDVLSIAYLGSIQIGLAYVALTRALRYVPGLEAATLLLLEPVFNPLWTWIFHGENPGLFAITGGALIIAATVGGAWYDSRSVTRPS